MLVGPHTFPLLAQEIIAFVLVALTASKDFLDQATDAFSDR
jgi:hypothetical protein